MKPFYKKLLPRIAEVSIAILVLLAILIGIARFFLPYVDRYHSNFEDWASTITHHPVKIEKVNASWKGLYPIFSLEQVEVFDANKTTRLLQVTQVRVGINLLASLITWQFKPSLLHLTGTHLSVRQIDPHTLEVNGIKLHLALPEPASGNTMEGLIAWLLAQGEIIIDDVGADWYGMNGYHLPLTNLQVKFSKGLTQHQLIGSGVIATQNPGRFRTVLKLQGNIGNRNIKVQGYLYLRNIDLVPLAKLAAWNGYQLVQGHLKQGRAWLEWSNKQVQLLQATFDLDHALLFSEHSLKQLPLDSLSGHAAWQKVQGGINVAANQLKIQIAGQSWPTAQVSFQHKDASSHSSSLQIFRLDKLNLANAEALAAFIVPRTNAGTFANTSQELVTALAPSGAVEDLLVRREFTAQEQSLLSAYARLNQWQWRADKKVPGIRNLSGQIKWTPNAGDMQLDGQHFELDYNSLFSAPLMIDNYSGRIEWINVPAGLKIRATELVANNSDISVRGNIDVSQPHPGSGDTFVRLLGSFTSDKIKHLALYLPLKVFPKPLAVWLSQAFVGGGNVQGRVLLQGPLHHFPFDDHSGHFEIAAKTESLNINYGKGWPMLTDLTADVHFDGRSMQLDSPSAKIFGMSTKPIHAEIADLSRAELAIKSGIEASLLDAKRFVFASPLKSSLGGALKELQPNGMMQLGLHLLLPLHEGETAMRVNGNLAIIPGASLTLLDWDIRFEQLQGQVQFTENSVTAEDLKATWLGQPVLARITTEFPGEKQQVLKIEGRGSMPLSLLERYYNVSSLSAYLQGTINYVATLQAKKNKGQTQTSLILDSDLTGVSIDLPAPLKKTATEKAPSHIELAWGEPPVKSLQMSGNYDKKLSAALALKNTAGQWALDNGNLRFGATPATLMKVPGLIIDGELASLDWNQVENDLLPLFVKKKTLKPQTPAWVLNKINLTIGQLAAFGMNLNQAHVQIQPLKNAWSLQIDSPLMAGRLILSEDLLHQGIQGEFTRFTLLPGSSKVVSDINPGKLPPLNLVIRSFYYGEKAFGEVRLRTFPQSNTMQIEQLAIRSPYYELIAAGQWRQLAKGRDQTVLNGALTTTNLGASLRSLGLTGSLEGSKGKASFALAWPAAAFNAGAANLNGNFSLDFLGGRIINISQSTEADIGLGRLLNLFSLQSIPRRLTLDFSDLTQKGFNYDEMKGNFAIHNGQVTTKDAYLDGPIAKVEIKGRIGLAAKDYDLRMLMTPYVTSSVPVVAAFAGGPVVGAAAFVAQKVLGNVVGKITSHSYQVTGSWANPNIIKLSQLDLLLPRS